MLQQFGTHQMRGFIKDISQTHIDVGFAKIDRVQLGMTVGEMQQRNIAKLGNHIQNRLQPARRTPGVTEVRCAPLRHHQRRKQWGYVFPWLQES